MTGDVMRVTLTRRMEERAARRRAAIVDALEEQGVAAAIEGEAVRASAPGREGALDGGPQPARGGKEQGDERGGGEYAAR